MPLNQIPEPWRSFLSALDGAATVETRLECLGGFVLSQLYELPRPTADLDSLLITPSDQRKELLALGRQGGPLHTKYGIYLDFVTIATVPTNYDERLTLMFPGAFKHLRLYALDPYDLALAKLGRNIQRDRDDVKHLARTVPLDLAILRRRYEEEMKPDIPNEKRESLTLNLWIEAIEEERGEKPPPI